MLKKKMIKRLKKKLIKQILNIKPRKRLKRKNKRRKIKKILNKLMIQAKKIRVKVKRSHQSQNPKRHRKNHIRNTENIRLKKRSLKKC